jgi:putative membrane protein
VLTVVVAHADAPLAPHDLWSAWGSDPLVLGGLLVLAALHRRGRTAATPPWRARCFTAGLLAVGVALLTPLDALSSALASAHMVQHLLLVLVAAPLLALSAPGGVLLRGSPDVVRGSLVGWRRRLRLTGTAAHALRHPGAVWPLHVGALWAWHAAVLYGAALEHPVVHGLEHGVFLATGLLFWRIVVGARPARVSPGLGVLLLFGVTLQSALLALLLTFAGTPWYEAYATTTQAWGLEHLADQRLAGAIMWVPAGFVYLGAALTLLVRWLRGMADDTPGTDAVPGPPLPVNRDGRMDGAPLQASQHAR